MLLNFSWYFIETCALMPKHYGVPTTFENDCTSKQGPRTLTSFLSAKDLSYLSYGAKGISVSLPRGCDAIIEEVYCEIDSFIFT